jgi:hypothetical protein
VIGLVLALLGVAQPAWGASGWDSIGDGIDYREVLLPGPIRGYVARLDRNNPVAIIDSSIANGALAEGRETVSDMAARYDEAINTWGGAWGPRNHVVAAVNGSFFDLGSGDPQGGLIHSGWFTKWYGNLEGGSGFVWTMERNAFIGQCVYRRRDKQALTYLPDGARQRIAGIDVPHGENDLVLYTPDYHQETAGPDDVVALVEMTRPTMVMPLPAMVLGTVEEVWRGPGPETIPFDHILLSARGVERSFLLKHVQVGGTVGVSLEITDLGDDCATPVNHDWTKAYAGVGGSYDFLRDGHILDYQDAGATRRNPRTAVCFNDRYIYFVVIDGRQPGWSVGMTIAELAGFCKDDLEARWGTNQDGGGSSTMWVNGSVRNQPSDGQERPVANGLLMIDVEPMVRSDRFHPGDHLLLQHQAQLRQGPGTNQPVLTAIAPGSEVEVLEQANHLEGVLAKGSYWWKVSTGKATGWIDEQTLVGDQGLSVFRVGGSAGLAAPPLSSIRFP